MTFTYIAKNQKNGKRITATAESENMAALARQLYSQGLLPLKIVESQDYRPNTLKDKISLFKKKVRSKEVSVFTRQLAATLGAGLLLSDALETIAEDMENLYFQEIVFQVRREILHGANFSEALGKFPEVFPLSYISVVKTGEATGRLYKTLESLAKFLENVERMKEKVKTAIQYPIFIFSFACMVLSAMVVFIVPQFKDIFEQSGAKLPWLTRMIVGASEFLMHNGGQILLMGVIAVVVLSQLFRFRKVQYFLDIIKFKIPILGKEIVYKLLISRYCRTMSFLLASGLGMPTSLDISAQVVQHQILESSILNVKSRVISGDSFSEAMRRQEIFPRLVKKMSAVGEKAGCIHEMLQKTADYYDDELDNSIQGLMVKLEPALIIFVGILVGIVVVALYLPIFQFSTLVQR